MTHDDAFLQVIAESPADDVPRLIYADWLDDHDDPARAEFIRLQCRLAHAPGEEEAYALRVRERDLLDRHQARWLGPLWGVLSHWVFRRGFLDGAELDAMGYLTHAARVRSVPTLTRVAVDLRGITIPPPVSALVLETVARERLVLPLGLRGDVLILAACDPERAADLAPFLGRDLDIVSAPYNQLLVALNRHYLPDWEADERSGEPDTLVEVWRE